MSDTRISFTAAGNPELLRDGDIPAVPPGGIRIRNRCTLVSPGTELACLAGAESAWFRFPAVPGYCAVGTVEEVGPGVAGWQVGDAVAHYGGHRLWQTAVPGHDFLCRIPGKVAPEHAAFLHLVTIAMTALRRSAVELGDSVAVTGLGLVGNLAAQLAALQGAQVVACDIDPARVALACACGIDARMGAAGSALAGCAPSTLIEATGRAATLVEAIPHLARGAEVLLLGTPRARCDTDLAAVLRAFHLADSALTLKPAHEWIRPVAEDPFVKHSFARDSRIALALIAAGRLRVAPLITHRVRPAQAPAAYRDLAAGAPRYAGVVIDWSAEEPEGACSSAASMKAW